MQQHYDKTALIDAASAVLAHCQKAGATQAEVEGSVNWGYTVSVRLGQVETVEYHCDRGLGVTAYFDKARGSVSTNDLSPAALQEAARAACDIARSTSNDPCAGLADPHLMATHIPDLALCHPWALTVPEAIDLATRCEDYGLRSDPRITKSDGTSLSTTEGFHVYTNSHQFLGHYATTRHSLSCVLIAEHEGQMQRDYSYTASRDPKTLWSAKQVGEDAAKHTVQRLQARKLSTRQAPVLFCADVARGLISHLISAISGNNLYRKTSFLVDHLGKKILPDHISIYEEPLIPAGLGSTPFDNEGLATRPKKFIDQGILSSYVLGSYSARKLGLQSTANAGGVFNLRTTHSKEDFAALLKTMSTGLIVTELMGQGVNIVTGDYSRGATGFWVENGEIQYPVEEITIAGNLKDMFAQLVTIGNDVDWRGNICCGSILIENMMIAGNSGE